MGEYCRHDHECCGITDCYCSHYHKVTDVESCRPLFLGGGYDHVHYYSGKTSKDDGHRHKVCYYTGPALPAATNSGHYHYFYGITTCDDGHIHYFRGMTDIYESCD